MTAQEVIKSFINQLANHGYAASKNVGVNMLDSAIRASSRFESIQDVIDSMKAAQIKAEKKAVEEILGRDYAEKTISEISSEILNADAKNYDAENKSNAYYDELNDGRSTVENFIRERKAYIFLEEYCGIILPKKCWFNSKGNAADWGVLTGNVDTGAITGFDAGGSSIKTAQSVIPEDFVNTYTALTSISQNITTDERNWVIYATETDDTITSNGADFINAGSGSDKIIVNASGATINTSNGDDYVIISEDVNEITLSDLNEYDTLTISGEFKINSAQIEDDLLVITDKTGKRKIRFGDFDSAKFSKINSTTIGEWLINSGINLNNLTTKNYSDDKVISNANISDDNVPSITLDLSTVETGAANDFVVDGVVVGSLSSTFPNVETFNRNGLTIHLLGTTSNTAGDASNIQAKTIEELTDAQKTVIAGLFKWWISESLKLSEESFGISFNSSTAMVKDMVLFFFDSQGNGNVLAATPYWSRSDDGATTRLMLTINMHYYDDISSDNLDGTSSNPNITAFLDRTLAHELTHSVMETNINFFSELPQFVVEGSAELVHGIDDERCQRIFSVAADNSKLNTVLDLTNKGTSENDFYAGGYMFFRYFAKQAAIQTEFLPAFGEITATVNLSDDGDYYIGGNSTSEIASTTAQEIKLGTVLNGVYTVENTGVHQVIQNTNNLKIVGLTVNDTLIGSDAADIVETAEGSFIMTGGGADSIKISGQYATIEAGDDNDSIIAFDGGHHSVNLGDGNNFIRFNQSSTYGNTVISGAGNDSIFFNWTEDASVISGSGDDSIYFGGKNNTILTGAGNDFIYQSESDGNFFVFNSNFGNDTIRGLNSNDTIIIPETFTATQRDSLITITSGSAFKGIINLMGFKNTANIISQDLEDDGENVIKNSADNVLIEGTSADDTIINSGNDVSISAGGGSNFIQLGGVSVTINVESGDDTISVMSTESFTVENFGAGDEILLDAAIDEFESIDGGIKAGDVTIKGLNLPVAFNEWAIENDVAIYAEKISEGVTLSSDKKSVIYQAAKEGETLIELGGIASAPTVKGNIVKLSAKNFAGNVSVISGNFNFELSQGNYSNKIFSGSSGDDKISNKGTSLKIFGEAGDDLLTGGTSKDFLDGGEGNDTLFGGTGNDTFAYTGGADLIVDYTAKDKIIIGGGLSYKDFAIEGSDLIFNFGEVDSLTIKNSKDKAVNMNSIVSFYTADGIFDKDKKSVILKSETKKFSALKYPKLLTIDGSASGSVEIIGNKKANVVYAGAKNSTINGGKGNDTLIGGDGEDIFVFEKSSGKDIIDKFSEGDMISLGSGVTLKSFFMKNNNAVMKIGNGSLTVNDTSEFKFAEDGVTKIFSEGNIADITKTSVTLSTAFKNEFELGNYKDADASFVSKSITFTGNDKDNYLIGGKKNDVLSGGAGADSLWGGKGNDLLTGGDGSDKFIYVVGSGNDTISDYNYLQGDMLEILKKTGDESTFSKVLFRKDTLTLSIKGGGKVVFKNVTSNDNFIINSKTYRIEEKKLVELPAR